MPRDERGTPMANKKEQNGSTEKAVDPKRLNKEQYVKHFAEYDAADKVYQDCMKALQAAKEKRSAIVQGLCAGMGGSKGPYKHPKTGLILTIVERKSKDDDGKETGESNWYFKGPSSSDVIDVNQL